MADRASHPILATQAKYNRSTADSWESYASHRAETAALLEPLDGAAHGGGRLCVLGAGNCNDLHLSTLLEQYDELHLVDIDAAAIDGATKRQSVAGSAKVALHGGVDLTGIAETLSAWKSRRPSSDEAHDAVRRAAAAPPPSVGGPFDVVLSPCVLSQISGFARDALGKQHPRYGDLLVAIRDRHLRLLAELARPGGTALLVCDMLSSDSFAELSAMKRDKLPALMDRLVYRGDFFPGLAPSQVLDVFRHDPLIVPLLSEVKLLRPWVWQLTPTRTFLVYAVRIRRREGALLL